MTIFSSGTAAAQGSSPLVHMAKLQIDPAQLESYKAALKEHAETAVRVEPGVLTLYAVSDKNEPTHITVFEYMPIPPLTNHICKALISKNTKALQRTWLSRLNSSRPFLLPSLRRTGNDYEEQMLKTKTAISFSTHRC